MTRYKPLWTRTLASTLFLGGWLQWYFLSPLADQAVDIGFFVSLSGIYTFKRTEEVRNAVADVPLDRLLVETDAPYLAPVPKRGKRNEPSFVAHTAARLAEERGLELADVCEQTTENFFSLFSKTSPITENAAVGTP